MKQKTALEILKLGKNVFITGSAGTGKTYLLKQYIEYLKDKSIYPTIVAPTGIAASHLKGQTIHSFFALGLRDKVDNYYVESLLKKNYLRKRFDKLKVLIIDEVSMVSPEIFSSMDRVLTAFKKSYEPFGGVQVVISGDFFQLPPVSREFKEKRFAWQSLSWKELDLKSCYLNEKFRQDDNRLIKILDDIRIGSISEESHTLLNSCLNKKLSSNFNPTRLYTHNMDVDKINMQELSKLTTKSYLYDYTAKGSEKEIEKIFKTAMVLKQLHLKKGAVVIFIKNNPDKEYINGTTGVVVAFNKNIPIVKTSTGDRIEVLAEDWIVDNEEGVNIATVTQLPLRLAWAITIHKSQGMTLDSAKIDLSKTFEVGQGYVALSRLKSLEGLSLLGINSKALFVEPLSLKIDEHIERASIKATKELESYSKYELEKAQNDYIRTLYGTAIDGIDYYKIEEKDTLKDDKKVYMEIENLFDDEFINRKEKPVVIYEDSYTVKYTSYNSSTPSYLKTKDLIDSCHSIKEIAKRRSLVESTILIHLYRLKEEDDTIDLSKFKPKKKIIEDISKATLKLKDSEENLNDDGSVRLKSIFEFFNRKYSYNKIRLAILFSD